MRLAEAGSEDQRRVALRTLAASASIRTQRAMVTGLMRRLDVDVRALGAFPDGSGERRSAYDVNHGGRSALPGTKVRGESDPPSQDAAANEAFDGAGLTYELYETAFGRSSVDGAGLELISSVHYGTDFDNAFWNGGQMVYGDGSGHMFAAGALTKAVDVIGHELTHGVTQYTAGLEYHGQPGALNESMSDCFGSMVKQYARGQEAADADWLIGEGTLVPELGRALRSMKEPGTAFSGRQPARPDERLRRAARRQRPAQRQRRGPHQLGDPESRLLSGGDGHRGQDVGDDGPDLVRDAHGTAPADGGLRGCRDRHRRGRRGPLRRGHRAGGRRDSLEGGRRHLVRLFVIRGGGLAGVTTRTEVDSGSLGARELAERVESARLWDRAEPPAGSPGADETRYEISVEHEGRRRTLRVAEGDLPDDLRALVAWADGVPGRRFEIERGR
jgi:hypothetical protein